MNKIVYKNPDGSLSVITPAPDCGIALEAIALKDVPKGVPFKIIDESALPADRTFRDAWDLDLSDPDGVGADFGAGSDYAVIDWVEGNHPIVGETVVLAGGEVEIRSVHSWGAVEEINAKPSTAVKIDLAKAKEIKREALREERKPLLKALDVDYTRALEDNDITKLRAIADQKQALRDAPAHASIEEAKSPEELKAIKLIELV